MSKPYNDRPSRTKLAPRIQSLLNDGFSQNLNDVAVYIWPDRHWRSPGVAYTVGHEVHLRESSYCPDTWHGRFVLTHEFAHIVQRRLPRKAPHSRWQYDNCTFCVE